MSAPTKRIAVVGAGGHGKVVIDAIRPNTSMTVACVVDDGTDQHGKTVLGHLVSGGRDFLLANRSSIDGVIVAIGANRTRVDFARWLEAEGFVLLSVIHPAACVAPSAVVGTGTLIMPGAIVNADARIGRNVIVNSGAIVEHDCIVGDGVHVAPGAVLCGAAAIGSGTLVGAGAVVLPGVEVGDWTILKAGAVTKSSSGKTK